MQIYINVWKDKQTGEDWFEQQTLKVREGLDADLVAAIHDYELMGNKYNDYQHTLLINTERNTVWNFDIRPCVEEHNKREGGHTDNVKRN